MKKIISTILMIISIVTSVAVLAACGARGGDTSDDDSGGGKTDSSIECAHTGGEASCDELAICEKCGEAYGEALDHAWIDATCEAPKTCGSCGITDGEALGHAWIDATCEAPKTCGSCGATDGEVLEHKDEDLNGLCDWCDFTVKAPTSFTVNLVGDCELPAEGATVKIISGDNEIPLTTDENGNASCELVYFDEVRAVIDTLPDGFISETMEFTFDGTSLNIELTEVYTYDVYVLDENESPLVDIMVSFKRPSRSVRTDENGLARLVVPKKEMGENDQFAYIPSMPEGYALYDTQLNTVFQLNSGIAYTAHAAKTMEFSLSAKDTNGIPIKNASFTLTNDYDITYNVVTDESGAALALLPKGEYTVEISHLSSFFTPSSEFITLNTENNSYEATFEENTGLGPLTFTIYYSDGSAVEPGAIDVYTFYGDGSGIDNLLGVNTNNQAISVMKNMDCFVFAIDADGNYATHKYYKNDPTDIDIIINKGDIAGSSAEHPFPALALTDLPYSADAFIHSYEREFSAGESVYLNVMMALEKTVTIDGSKFSLEYNGAEIGPGEDGIISLTFTDVQYGADAIIKITAKVDATEDLDIYCAGTFEDPILIYSNKAEQLTQNIKFYGVGQTKYFMVANMNAFSCKVLVNGEGIDVSVEYPEGDVANSYNFIDIVITANEIGEVTITFSLEEHVE